MEHSWIRLLSTLLLEWYGGNNTLGMVWRNITLGMVWRNNTLGMVWRNNILKDLTFGILKVLSGGTVLKDLTVGTIIGCTLELSWRMSP